MRSGPEDPEVFNWNDVRVFLAVADTGSTLAAASVIGLNQTTVARRIEALEHALNLELFERDNRGYRLTAQGLALLDDMKGMGSAATKVRNSAEHLSRDDQGIIRFAGNAEAMQRFGISLVSAYRERNADVHFELQIDVAWDKDQPLLETGRSDIALRPLDEISGDTLIARKVARIPLAIYCSRSYQKNYGAPRTLEEARNHKFLVYSEDIAQVMKAVRWLNDQLEPSQILYQANAVSSMAAALQSGEALGLLPCMTGDATPDLVQCFKDEALQHTLWLVASRESYGRPAVRKFMAFGGQYFRKLDSP